MPNNVTNSPRDEEKWEKAEGIAKKQLGHAPKSDNDWAYVMGIYKRMKPDHQFQSEKSASSVVDQWMARRVAASKEAREEALTQVGDDFVAVVLQLVELNHQHGVGDGERREPVSRVRHGDVYGDLSVVCVEQV